MYVVIVLVRTRFMVPFCLLDNILFVLAIPYFYKWLESE